MNKIVFKFVDKDMATAVSLLLCQVVKKYTVSMHVSTYDDRRIVEVEGDIDVSISHNNKCALVTFHVEDSESHRSSPMLSLNSIFLEKCYKVSTENII